MISLNEEAILKKIWSVCLPAMEKAGLPDSPRSRIVMLSLFIDELLEDESGLYAPMILVAIAEVMRLKMELALLN